MVDTKLYQCYCYVCHSYIGPKHTDKDKVESVVIRHVKQKHPKRLYVKDGWLHGVYNPAVVALTKLEKANGG